MMMDHYVLFKSNKRVTVREDDMSTEKIGRIFQVQLIKNLIVLIKQS